MKPLRLSPLPPLLLVLAASQPPAGAATLSGLGIGQGPASLAGLADASEYEAAPPPPPAPSPRADAASDIVAISRPADAAAAVQPVTPDPSGPSRAESEAAARRERAAERARQARAADRAERLRALRLRQARDAREARQDQSRIEANRREEAALLRQEQEDQTPAASSPVPAPTTGTAPPPVLDKSSAKTPPARTAAVSPWEYGLKLDWRDKYFFRGLEVPERTSLDSSHSGFLTTTGSATYRQGRHAVKGSISLLSSLDDYLPNGDIDLGNDSDQIPPSREGDENFGLPKRDRYNEWTFSLAYANSISEHFNIALGLNYYRFSDGRFWQQNYQKPINDTTEASLTLAFPDLLKATAGSTTLNALPTLQWVHDFDSFSGDYVVAGLSATVSNPSWRGVTLNPFARVSYDFDYNGTNDGWNNVEAGLSINQPVPRLKNGFITVTAGYNHDLGAYGGATDRIGRPVDRTDDGWWFGAAYSTTFGIGSAIAPDPVLEATGKGLGKFTQTTGPSRRWSLGGGIGQRSISSSFSPGAGLPAIGDLRSYNRQQWNETTETFDTVPLVRALPAATGATTFATQGSRTTYEDGTVRGAWTGGNDVDQPADGTSDFTIASGGQVLGTNTPPDPGADVQRWSGDRRILFKSRTYEAAPDRFERYDISTRDSDEFMVPYITASYDFYQNGPFALSFGASYTIGSAALDTGTRLTSLATAYENELHHTFVYQMDERFSYDYTNSPNSTAGPGWLVMDANAYEANYGGGLGELDDLDPQRLLQTNTNEVARLAGFMRSGLDVNLHEIALPLQGRLELSNHAALTFSAGPTINIFNAELESEYLLRALDNRAAGVIASRDATYETYRVSWTVGEESGLAREGAPSGGQVPTVAAGAAGSVSPAPTSPADGGKGRPDTYFNLPGNSVAPASAVRSVRGAVITPSELSRGVARRLDQETEVSIGLAAQAGLRFDLDDQDKWYLDIWGKYSYVKDFTLNNGFSTADVDASAWSYGVGLGYRW